MTKRIAVTGGKGFIGSAVADAAEAAGHEVMFFDRRDGNDILGPLDALEGADSVIHLAGVIGTMELFDDVPGAVCANVEGSARIMEWCLSNDAGYVGILVPMVFPSIYCSTKRASADLASILHTQRGLKVSHVTAFNAHGPGQAYGPGHPQKFGPTFSINAWNGRPIPIWGDGTALVDPVTVATVGKMLVSATDFHNDELFDGGTGETLTVNEIAEIVLEVTGSTAGIEYLPMRVGETPTNVAATGVGWDLLDWEPPAFSRDELVKTIEWYKGKDFVHQSGTR